MNENHDVPVSGINPFVEGAYVTGNPVTGIRDYAMNWPMSGDFPEPGRNPKVNSLNLGDYEFDITGQEVHADGEIWVAANYTLRQLFLNRYPAHGTTVDRKCAIGQIPVAQCPGDRRWIQLSFDAMLLMPTSPTLIDARNAYPRRRPDPLRRRQPGSDLARLRRARASGSSRRRPGRTTTTRSRTSRHRTRRTRR